MTVKDCRAIVAVTVTGCTELTSLNLSGSYLEKWESEPNSGKWIYPSINIYTNTKLTDPANFIPAANLVDIWATSAQIEALESRSENTDRDFFVRLWTICGVERILSEKRNNPKGLCVGLNQLRSVLSELVGLLGD